MAGLRYCGGGGGGCGQRRCRKQIWVIKKKERTEKQSETPWSRSPLNMHRIKSKSAKSSSLMLRYDWYLKSLNAVYTTFPFRAS